ncbi:hypothetical protein D3C71_1565240 [compost metagenome]
MREAQALAHRQIRIDAVAEDLGVFLQPFLVDRADAVIPLRAVLEYLAHRTQVVGVMPFLDIGTQHQHHRLATRVGAEMRAIHPRQQRHQALGHLRPPLAQACQVGRAGSFDPGPHPRIVVGQARHQAGKKAIDKAHEGFHTQGPASLP